MERDQGDSLVSSHEPLDGWSRPAVFSRRQALERLHAMVQGGQDGPTLITGEPGAGKSWLAQRLVEHLPANWHVARVDLAPALDEIEFLRQVGRALGISMPDRLGAARQALCAVLEDERTDGRSWLLIVDEAHRGRAGVWAEIQSLAKQVRSNGGFKALLVLGQTELARALGTRQFAAFATRLSAHIHLMPIDLDEARELLGASGLGEPGALSVLEELHRDAHGNPSRLLRLAGLRRWRAPWSPGGLRARPDLRAPAQPAVSAAQFASSPEPQAGTSVESEPTVPVGVSGWTDSAPLIPCKPPIRIEEGLVEVGWEGDLLAECPGPSEPVSHQQAPTSDNLPQNEQLVEDRYAALQAWTEWKKNRDQPAGGEGQSEATAAESSPGETALSEPVSRKEDARGAGTGRTSLPGHVRAESQHDFAPYSQLFTRLRQSKQPGS